jgi:hypothetical protein
LFPVTGIFYSLQQILVTENDAKYQLQGTIQNTSYRKQCENRTNRNNAKITVIGNNRKILITGNNTNIPGIL